MSVFVCARACSHPSTLHNTGADSLSELCATKKKKDKLKAVTPVLEVDAHNIVPVWEVLSKGSLETL